MQNLSRRLRIFTMSVSAITKSPLQTSFFRIQPFRLGSTNASKPHECAKCEPKPDHSWTDNPDCGKDECAEARRLDDVCPEEDLCDRGPFNQTWAECPPRIVEELPFCFGEKMPIPTPRKGRPRPVPKQMGLKDKNDRCPKIKFANCKDVSKVVKCKRTRMPSDCVPTPSPCLSFSECEKDLPPWKKPTECNCFEKQCPVTDE